MKTKMYIVVVMLVLAPMIACSSLTFSKPTSTPLSTQTSTSTLTPTLVPTITPTLTPTMTPTFTPTIIPTLTQTEVPSGPGNEVHCPPESKKEGYTLRCFIVLEKPLVTGYLTFKGNVIVSIATSYLISNSSDTVITPSKAFIFGWARYAGWNISDMEAIYISYRDKWYYSGSIQAGAFRSKGYVIVTFQLRDVSNISESATTKIPDTKAPAATVSSPVMVYGVDPVKILKSKGFVYVGGAEKGGCESSCATYTKEDLGFSVMLYANGTMVFSIDFTSGEASGTARGQMLHDLNTAIYGIEMDKWVVFNMESVTNGSPRDGKVGNFTTHMELYNNNLLVLTVTP